jgi:hypothetical protein
MSGEEDDVRLYTPEEWIPFDTILCTCDGTGRGRCEYLYLGIGQYIYPPGSRAVANEAEVQLLLNLGRDYSSRGPTWSNGDWLRKNAHVHDKHDPEIIHDFH